MAAAVLIVDISGFTEVTERMMEHARSGAELLAETLRFYFDPLIAAVHQAGGFIIGFAGDSFTAIFPDSPKRKVAEYALGAAVAMRRFFLEHPERETVYGSFPFSFKIAITWGDVEWGIVRQGDDYFLAKGGPGGINLRGFEITEHTHPLHDDRLLQASMGVEDMLRSEDAHLIVPSVTDLRLLYRQGQGGDDGHVLHLPYVLDENGMIRNLGGDGRRGDIY